MEEAEQPWSENRGVKGSIKDYLSDIFKQFDCHSKSEATQASTMLNANSNMLDATENTMILEGSDNEDTQERDHDKYMERKKNIRLEQQFNSKLARDHRGKFTSLRQPYKTGQEAAANFHRKPKNASERLEKLLHDKDTIMPVRSVYKQKVQEIDNTAGLGQLAKRIVGGEKNNKRDRKAKVKRKQQEQSVA